MPKKPKPSSKSKKSPQRVRSWALSLGAVALCLAIIAVALWFFFKPSRPAVAAFLPSDSTVAYLEQSDQPIPPDVQTPFSTLAGWMSFFSPPLASTVQELSDKNLLLQGGGAALIELDSSLIPVLFLPFRDLKTIEPYLTNASYQATLAPPYLLLSPEVKALERVMNGRNAGLTLDNDALYEKSRGQLPRSPWMRGFLSSAALSFFLNQDQKDAFLDPLQATVDHASFTLRTDHQGVRFNMYVAFVPNVFKTSVETEPRSATHSYQLTELVGTEHLLAYTGGSNLNREWQNTLQTLQAMNPAYAIIFEGILGAQVKRLFGDGVHLRNDLYPLFDGEYALAFYGAMENPLGATLLLAHNDRAFAEAKMKKLMEGFRVAAAAFVPRVEIYDLPDGTQSKVLTADPNRLRSYEEDYEGYPLSCLEVTETSYGFCFLVTDRFAVMTNTFAQLKTTVDSMIRPRFILSQYQPFRKGLNQLAAVSDEISFVSLNNVADYMANDLKKGETIYSRLLSGFDSITWTKQYFRDGMSAEGTFLLQ